MGEPLDGRAYQYSLAATAYQLLTGSQLFPHSNPAVVISRHLNSDPPAASHHGPELATIDAVLSKALSKAPEDRYSSCKDFGRSLAGQVTATTSPIGHVIDVRVQSRTQSCAGTAGASPTGTASATGPSLSS